MTQSNGKQFGSNDDDDVGGKTVAYTGPEKPGFFTVYKKGQGYWTRLGTALGAALLVVVLGLFVYEQSHALLATAFYTPQAVPTAATADQAAAINNANIAGSEASMRTARTVAACLTAFLCGVGAVAAWRLMNAPRSVDFLISTDSEMKKVNWTSREELIGSTRVVILFLFVIALLLFLIDVGSGAFFQWIGLLKFGVLS